MKIVRNTNRNHLKLIKTSLIAGALFGLLLLPSSLFAQATNVDSINPITSNGSSIVLNTLRETGFGFINYVAALAGKKHTSVNMNNKEDFIRVVDFGFKTLGRTMDSLSAQSVYTNALEALDDAVAEVIGKALVYPSPMNQRDGGELGYRLSKDMDLELRIYDMQARMILKNTFDKGANRGKKGYNRLVMNLETFEGFQYSAGVYFFVLMNEGNILTKGKMAVVP